MIWRIIAAFRAACEAATGALQHDTRHVQPTDDEGDRRALDVAAMLELVHLNHRIQPGDTAADIQARIRGRVAELRGGRDG